MRLSSLRRKARRALHSWKSWVGGLLHACALCMTCVRAYRPLLPRRLLLHCNLKCKARTGQCTHDIRHPAGKNNPLSVLRMHACLPWTAPAITLQSAPWLCRPSTTFPQLTHTGNNATVCRLVEHTWALIIVKCWAAIIRQLVGQLLELLHNWAPFNCQLLGCNHSSIG